MKRKIAIFLMLALILPLVFWAPPAEAAEIVENIPTIFVGNDAWYKYKLLPLITEKGEHCVPISVFSAFDFLKVSENEIYHSLLISADDGRFLSINTENGRYLTDSGDRGDIRVLSHEKEYYISASKAASLLGIGIETAIFYDKDVIRLFSKGELQALEILIDAYISADAVLPGSVGSGVGTARRKSTFSAIVDITASSEKSIETLLEATDLIGATMTFAINEEFLRDADNLPILLRIAASGHTFAVTVMGESARNAPGTVKSCNEILSRILKKKTMLVLADKTNSELTKNGYILLTGLQKVSEISIGSLNFGNNKTIFLDSTEMIDISKFVAIADAAERNGKDVVALNQLTGN